MCANNILTWRLLFPPSPAPLSEEQRQLREKAMNMCHSNKKSNKYRTAIHTKTRLSKNDNEQLLRFNTAFEYFKLNSFEKYGRSSETTWAQAHNQSYARQSVNHYESIQTLMSGHEQTEKKQKPFDYSKLWFSARSIFWSPSHYGNIRLYIMIANEPNQMSSHEYCVCVFQNALFRPLSHRFDIGFDHNAFMMPFQNVIELHSDLWSATGKIQCIHNGFLRPWCIGCRFLWLIISTRYFIIINNADVYFVFESKWNCEPTAAAAGHNSLSHYPIIRLGLRVIKMPIC